MKLLKLFLICISVTGVYAQQDPVIAVAPDKMNVFYIGVENPVTIAAAGIPAKDIIVEMSGSSEKIEKKRDGQYVVKCSQPGYTRITIYTEKNGKKEKLGDKKFRVKQIPDPVVKAAGQRGGYIKKEDLLNAGGVFAEIENCPFDIAIEVVDFTVSATHKGFVSDARTRGSKFTDAQIGLIKRVFPGEKVYIEMVKVVLPDGRTLNAHTISFIISGPVPGIAGKTEYRQSIEIDTLLKYGRLDIYLIGTRDGCYFRTPKAKGYQVTSFTMTTNTGKKEYKASAGSAEFTEEMKRIIKKVDAGQEITFMDVMVKDENGKEMELRSLTLVLK